MRSTARRHEQQFFYKYMPTETAIIVLQNKTLRWSSPIIFNDPFDVPREFLPDVTDIQVWQALKDKTLTEIQHPSFDLQRFNKDLISIVKHLKHKYPKGVPEELISKFKTALTLFPIPEDAKKSLQIFKENWLSSLNKIRILCLSESPTILPMWNHYADGYKGIVLEIRCSDELDSASLVARPVNYSNKKPLTYTAEGVAELFHLEPEEISHYITHELPYIKTMDWAYEREWRISYPCGGDGSNLYNDLKFNPGELNSVILGPDFDDSKLPFLIELIKQYRDTILLRAKFTKSREIIFEKIN